MALSRMPDPPVRPRATLVYAPHPVLADAGRVIVQTVAYQGETLGAYLRRHGVDTAHPLVVTVNGAEIARARWELLDAEPGALVCARAALAGGGGSNPLRLVALIALAVAAPMLASAALGTTAGAYAATALGGVPMFMGVATAVVTMAGSMLVNKLLPPQTPTLGRSMSEPKASPTYSIAGGRNQQRPYEPLPLVLGTHRVFFDLAGKPYTTYAGDEQYLYQVFLIGMTGPHGALDVSDLRIGETALSEYDDVQTEMTVGALPTLFPANVDTVAGGVLTAADGPITRTTGADCTRIEIDIVATAFEARDDGSIGGHLVTFTAQYRPSGSAAPWTTLVDGSTSGNKTQPVRLTYGAAVPAGTYDVRVQRTSADATSDRITADLQWSALKSYQPDDGYYASQQFLAVRIRATGQLNGVIDRLNGIVRMPTAPGVYSSNPADLFRLFAVGHQSPTGRALWGGQLSPSDVDAAGLEAWAGFCTAKGLSFNAVIDAQRSVWDVLQGIARCGRGSPTWATGKLGVVWDAEGQPVVAHYGMANIRRGSFQIEYQSEDPVDEVVLNYIDAANGYQPDEVRAVAPGVLMPQKTATIECWGCTSRAMAVRECFLSLAENLYRTRLVSWETDMEGLVVTRGDVVSLSHDMTQWGQSGRLVSGTASMLELDQDITVTPGGTWITIITPEGAQHVCRVDGPAGTRSTITLLDPLPAAPDDDTPVDWRYTADYLATPGKLLKIVNIVPGMRSARIQAVDEYDEYYAAENGSYTPPARRPWQSDQPQIRSLAVVEEAIRSDAGSHITRLAITWSESGAVASRTVRYAIEGGPLQVAGSADTSRYDLIVPDVASVTIVVTLYDGAGQTTSAAQASVTHTLQGIAYAPRPPLTLTALGGIFQIRLRWTFTGSTADVRHVEIWSNTINARATASLLTTIAVPTDTWLHDGLQMGQTRYYWARVVDTRGRPSAWMPADAGGGVSATTSTDPSAILDLLVGSITEDQLYQDLASRIDQIDDPVDGALVQLSGLQTEVMALQAQVADLEGAVDYDPGETYYPGDIVKHGGALYRAIATTTGHAPPDPAWWQKIGDYASIGDAVAGLAVAVDALETRVDVAESGLAAEVTARQTLATQMRGAYAGTDLAGVTSGLIWSERQARSSADAAEVTARQSLAATLTGYADPTGKTLAQISSGILAEEKTARSSADSALTSSIVTLNSTVGSHTASIQTQAASIDGLKAQYTIKVDNNGYMSGFGLASTPVDGTPYSTFTVLADKFLVVIPGKTPQVPFAVGMVNGVSTVGINGALTIDGSMTANKIDSRGLTIKDPAGNVILSSGVNLDWGRVAGKPDDQFNLCIKSSFEDWQLGGWSGAVSVVIANTSFSSKALATTARDAVLADRFSVTPGEKIEVEAALLAVHVNYPLRVGLFIYDKAGTAFAFPIAISSSPGEGWAIKSGTLTIPANASKASCFVQIDGSSGLGTGLVTNLRYRRYTPITSDNVSTYIAGAAIGNAQIASLSADKINAGKINSDRIDTNLLAVKKFDNVTSRIINHLGVAVPLTRQGFSIKNTATSGAPGTAYCHTTITDCRTDGSFVAFMSGVLGDIQGMRVQYSVNGTDWINSPNGPIVSWSSGAYRPYSYYYYGKLTFPEEVSTAYFRIYFSGNVNHTELQLIVLVDNTN